MDYDDTFTFMDIYTTIEAMISFASIIGWKLHQMDVNMVFLNDEVEKEVCIEHLDGLVIHGKESHVCKLKKSLYGLKQAPSAWYARIDNYLQRLGFSKSES